MRKALFFLTAACALILAGCTAKEVLITDPVKLNFELLEVKGSKIIFRMDPANPDACYTYGLFHSSQDIYDLPDRQLAQKLLDAYKEGYEILVKEKGAQASFVDVNCYRGSRTLRITAVQSDQDYKLVIFQVNPKTIEILGDVLCVPVHTVPVPMTDLHFTFQTQGEVMTITPSDPDCLYYWDYDPTERIYDEHLGPNGFFYHLLDMFDEYGFMDEVYSKGAEDYDFSKDHLISGKEYLIVAAACKDGEITSDLQVMSFVYKRGNIVIVPYD
jgi:hypothetical protein